MQFSEERFQLFESIQEMIDNEIKKRGLNKYQYFSQSQRLILRQWKTKRSIIVYVRGLKGGGSRISEISSKYI